MMKYFCLVITDMVNVKLAEIATRLDTTEVKLAKNEVCGLPPTSGSLDSCSSVEPLSKALNYVYKRMKYVFEQGMLSLVAYH